MPAPPPGLPDIGYATTAPPSNTLSMWAMVCGISSILLSLFCSVIGVAPAVVGLVMGIMGNNRTKRDPIRYTGRGMAIAGICTSIAGLLLFGAQIALIAFFMASMPSTISGAMAAGTATVNLQQVGTAIQVYQFENNGALPPDFDTLVDAGHLPDTAVFDDPSDMGTAPGFTYVPLPVPVDELKDPAQWIIAFGNPSDYDGWCGPVMRADGSVENVEEPRFTREMSAFIQLYEDTFCEPPTFIEP